MKTNTINKFAIPALKVFLGIAFIGFSINCLMQLTLYTLLSIRVLPAMPRIFTDYFDNSADNQLLFVFIVVLKLIYTILIAYISFLFLKLVSSLKLENPFSIKVKELLRKVAVSSFILSIVGGIGYFASLYFFPDTTKHPIEWMEGAIVLFTGFMYVIYLIFDKGLQLQAENDLTI